ncbi:MAG TPA: EAL domain-containing protein [Ilumatobacteraceae bacterium]
MTKAGAPTRGEQDACLRERALVPVVANTAIAPFWLFPFTVLVSVLTNNDIGMARLQLWIGAAVVSSVVIVTGVTLYRRQFSNGPGQQSTTDRSPTLTPKWLIVLLRAGLVSMSFVFGMSTWVAGSSSTEMIMLFAVFPTTASAISAMLTAGRRDMFLSLLLPMAAMSAGTLMFTHDIRLRGMAALWLFYSAALTVIHSTLSKTVRTAILLQKTSEDLLEEIERDQAQLTETNAQLAISIEQLTHQATHDALTGLLNRRGMFEALEGLIGESSTNPVGVLFLDLDRFKAVNDTLGHRGGDHFLRIVSDRIERSVQAKGIAGRIGGDEFVVALPGADEQTTVAVAHQLQGVLAQAIHAAGRELPSSVSIGIAHAPTHGGNVSEVLANANVALYQAKTSGRSRVTHFDTELARENRGRIDLELRLRRAIDDGDIVPFFQPELDASTGMIVGAELLARWVQPNGTVVAAHEFMELAVRAGLLDKVTERVFGGARRQIRRLAVLGLPEGFRFRVNLAPHSTERPWRDNPIDLLVNGIDPHLLTVDVRESFVTVDLPSAASNLAEFRASGGRVCLDDFAQGVSSLSMLRRLPLDEVRIDRISIDTITTHPHDRAIVRSIIALTREIGLEVTADGVETGAQADALIALGCVRQQGHLYAPALPEQAFENYLLHRLAEQYVRATDTRPTWNTHELT